MNKCNHEIICFSTQPWNDFSWTNKQHIMNRLSKDNNILYVFKDGSFEGFILSLIRGKRHVLDIFKRYKRLNENLMTISPHVFYLGRYFRVFRAINNIIVLFSVKKWMKKLKIENPILWAYHPESSYFIGKINESLVLYDCVDEYSETPAYNENKKIKEWIVKAETKLLKKADVVVATSEKLFSEKNKYNSSTYLVENVGDYEHFSKAALPETKIPEDIKGLKKHVIGYYGVISSYKVDFELLSYVAEKRPDWYLVLIGGIGIGESNTDISILKSRSNIRILGGRDYSLLPGYVKAFDVCIIPYARNEYTDACFPIKFNEYLASGKPVVSTALPSLLKFGDVASLAKDRDEFITYIENALAEKDPAFKEKRLEHAKKNTWEVRIGKIMALLESALQKKELKNTQVLCFSINYWEKRWARKQHFSREFSRRPEIDKVYYIEPPVSLHDFILSPKNALKNDEWKARWKRAFLVRADNYTKELFILTPLFILPFMRVEWLNKINRALSLGMMKLLRRLPKTKESILWLYHPYDYYLAEWFDGCKVSCFDWAEKWGEYFTELKGNARKDVLNKERKMLERVDLVFTVSKVMENEAKGVNKNSLFLPSGTVSEIFAPGNNSGLAEIMKQVKKPVLGYMGTVNERFDVETFAYLAGALPECSIVVVGDYHSKRVDISSLKGISNIHFTGGVDFWELPKYTNGFDVCIMPYVPANTEVEPTKIYDYLSTGKPVITSKFPEIMKFEGLIDITSNKEEFFAAVKRLLTFDPPEDRERRLRAAGENSWRKRIEDVYVLIKKEIQNKEINKKKKKLLVIPHIPSEDSVRVRELELAKALSVKYNVYYLTWAVEFSGSKVKRLKNMLMDIFRRVKLYKKGDVRAIRVPIFRRPLKISASLNRLRLKRIMQKEKIDILLNSSIHAFPAPCKDAGERKNFKYIYDLVDLPYMSSNDNFDDFKKEFVSAELKKADLVLTVSVGLAEWLKKNHNKTAMPLVNGVDLECIENMPVAAVKELKVKLGLEGKIVFSVIGNVGKWVDLRFILEAFTKLKKDMPGATLLIVGPVQDDQQLKKKYAAKDIIFTGAVNSQEINKYFQATDVGIVPSVVNEFQNVSFHIKVIEYTAARKIVVASPLVEITRLSFPNILIAPLIEKEWLEELRQAAEMKWDKSWSKNIRSYDWKAIAEKLAAEAEKL